MATDTNDHAGFYTVEEIAAKARVSKMTIYRMVKDGTLPHVRIGKQIRIKVADAAPLLPNGGTK